MRLLCTLVSHHARYEDVQTIASLMAVFVSTFGAAELLGEEWRDKRRHRC